jgi:hypothetical protein
LDGDELRVGYGMETKFLGRVNSIKENTLSGIGSPGFVGLAPVTTRVSRVKLFPYPGAIRLSGLAGLRSEKAKTSPRAGFDEDINTSARIIPSVEILGPITRSGKLILMLLRL